MTELVVLLTTGQGTWSEVAKLIRAEEWQKIFIITNAFGKDTFQKKENMEISVINPDDTMEKIRDSIQEQLGSHIGGPQIALNFLSGSGKEHMALLSAMLRLGLAIRLVYHDKNATQEL